MRSDESRLRRWRARRRVLAAAAIAVRSLAAALGVLLIATCVRDTILQSTGHDTAATSSTGSGPGVTAAAPPYPCSGYVALTFDDGPERYTGQLAAAVSASGLHATFFLVGRHVAQYPQVARDLARDGFVLGDHTWSHRVLTGLPRPRSGGRSPVAPTRSGRRPGRPRPCSARRR